MDCKDCKNCAHYEVCLFWTAIDVKRIFSKGGCGYFKDKSKIIELPCKIGDTVYQTDFVRIYKSKIEGISFFRGRIHFLTSNIEFDDSAIGKSIFFSREEAEKALKEKQG